jgi:hypothetical protein
VTAPSGVRIVGEVDEHLAEGLPQKVRSLVATTTHRSSLGSERRVS